MSSWSIRKKAEACSACSREFVNGESLFSLLTGTEEGLARIDLCPTCFAARDEAEAARDLFFWRTHRQEEKKKGLAVDFDAVEGLFLALEGREERTLAELRYLLALLLMRKKRLKLVRILRREDAEGMVMRRPRRDEALEVLVFDLTPERMAELRDDLARIFEGAGADEVLAASQEAEKERQEQAHGASEADDQDPEEVVAEASNGVSEVETEGAPDGVSEGDTEAVSAGKTPTPDEA